MLQIKYICLLLILCFNAACSRHALHDAQTVVAQADSLWHAGQMYGIDHGDSTSLAQAYETLGKFSLPFREGLGLGSSYAHACYHYGRLLRKKDDPVSAMQVFINATHSHTRDYHILGRIYSNMGEICHLAGDFPLSYDMFERSGNSFLKDGDTLSYYYLLNDMAFELAEQGKKDSTLFLICKIEKECTDEDVLNKTIETKARLYFKTEQFDSILLYTDTLLSLGYKQPTGLVLRAQAFDTLGMSDSAIFYAKLVLSLPSAAIQDKYNMLYITSHYDTTLANKDILDITSRRADIGIAMDNQHAQHARAVEILSFELAKKQNLQWLYAVCITILLISTTFILTYRRKRRQHLLLSQQVEELANKTLEMKREHINYTNTLISQLDNKCRLLVQTDDLAKQLCWNDYDQMSRMMDEHFFMLATKLQNLYQLSEKEIRLCVLVLLGVNTGKQLSEMLYYSESGIRNFKNRTAKKLGTNSTHLRETILKIAVSGEQKSPE